MRWHRDWSALRGFAVVGMLCALVVACRGGGGIATGGLVPAGPQTDSSFTKKRRPDVVRIVPFEKSPKLGVSAGQPVFALFSSKQLPLVSSTPDISVYGAPAVSGQAAPLGQIATITGPKSGQNLYVDAKGRLFELTDKSSSTLMLLSYPHEDNPTVFEARTVVCQSGREIGSIVEITRNGVTTTVIAKHAGQCPKSLTGAVAFGASADVAGDAKPPSKPNIAFYSCMMGSTLFSSASDRFYAAARLVKRLQGLGDTYGRMRTLFGNACSDNSLIVVQKAQTPPACTPAEKNQPVCAYNPPPVAITAAPASCPDSTTAVVFNAPNQMCAAAVAYNVGTSNAKYEIVSSNASIVSVTPTSGTVSGSGKLSFTMTAGPAGGTATVTATITNNGVPQSTSFSVSNAWTSSASNGIASIAFALPSGTLPLGQTMTLAMSAKTAAGVTISGAYDRPIGLTGTNLVISPSQVTNAAQAQQITITWKAGFSGTGSGTIRASADGHTASAQVQPGTGFAYYTTGSNPKFDVQGFLMTLGADGNLYYGSLGPTKCTTTFCTAIDGAIVRVIPSTGAFTEIELHAEPNGLLYTSDGAVWAAGGESHKLFRVPPGKFAAGSLQAIPVPSPNPASSYIPRTLTEDGAGNVWFTDLTGGRVLKTPVAGPYDGSAIVGYALANGPNGTPQGPARGQAIVYGRDENLYVSDRFNGVLDQVSPVSGSTTRQVITPQQKTLGANNSAALAFMAKDATGNLVLTLLGANPNPVLGAVDVLPFGTHKITGYALPNVPSGAEPYAVAANGNYAYYADLYGGLGMIDTSTGKTRLFPVAPFFSANATFSQVPDGVAVLPDGTAWFTCYGNLTAAKPLQPLCVGHTVYLGGWSLFPGPGFTISGYGPLTSQPVGIMEGPTADSGPFSVANSDAGVCRASAVNDHNFLVTGLAPGTCTLTVSDSGNKHSEQLVVTVQPSPSPTPAAAIRSRRVTF
jgi:hypothetical protein